jgi:hypothetical protein
LPTFYLNVPLKTSNFIIQLKENIMKKMNLTFALLISLLVFGMFAGCEKNEDESTNTTVEQDKIHIQESMNSLLTSIENLKNGEAVRALDRFLKMSEGDALNSDWVQKLFSQLDDQINLGYVDESNRFYFERHTGTYTWDPVMEQWNKSTSPEDQIVIKFPAQKSADDNNAVLKFKSYSDKNLSFNQEYIYLPKSLEANLKVDGEELFMVQLNEANYMDSDFSIPSKLDLDVKIKPFSYNIKMSQKSASEFHMEFSFDESGSHNFTLTSDITLKDSNYENFELYDDVEYVSGNITYEKLKLSYNADLGTLMALSDPTENQINSLVNVEVLYNKQNIGKLEYRKYDKEHEIYIIYKDESSENTAKYYKPFIEELELLLLDYTDEWKK